jgi:hypothetical protein
MLFYTVHVDHAMLPAPASFQRVQDPRINNEDRKDAPVKYVDETSEGLKKRKLGEFYQAVLLDVNARSRTTLGELMDKIEIKSAAALQKITQDHDSKIAELKVENARLTQQVKALDTEKAVLLARDEQKSVNNEELTKKNLGLELENKKLKEKLAECIKSGVIILKWEP